MTFIAVLLFFGLIAVLAITSKSKKAKQKTEPAQEQAPTSSKTKYTLKRKTLLTKHEEECFHKLRRSLAPDFLVFPQVALSQVIDATGGSYGENQSARSKIKQKVADFVVCKIDMSMIAVIELDDRSHNKKKEDDKIRDNIIQEAGLMAIRLKPNPDQTIIDNLAQALKQAHPRPEPQKPALTTA
ncbi:MULTISPECIES: DUF2726 domain-containing protein [Chromobacterium]|uniref:DUF2726 domain-containing protein n=1 Tax=Chromobacterium TaxID=535 RepID=UPI001889000F|nr:MULTISPECIES: DUF2726 domain-containing protein [Chromobacterium]QOZ84251.1 DUF2726 domain-containing protein [Chromobacterium sp. Rain0013]WON84419.1 DUF2726 domain-containing protein [Chromobacterium haemolyticum]